MITEKQEEILTEAVRKDPLYGDLFADCLKLESDYVRIKDSLSQEDGEILERYIALCEELEYRRTCIAMNLPKAE